MRGKGFLARELKWLKCLPWPDGKFKYLDVRWVASHHAAVRRILGSCVQASQPTQ